MKQIQIGGTFLAVHLPGERPLSHHSVGISENQWFNGVFQGQFPPVLHEAGQGASGSSGLYGGLDERRCLVFLRGSFSRGFGGEAGAAG